ncbi:MAG: hypothetical protein C0483_26190 [Pirellula sp.]|nr:hypothetical protein [Pirellula sp.]
MLIIGLMFAGMMGASAMTAWADEPQPAAAKSPPVPAPYVCPMHPQIQATFPGSCPICRMALKASSATLSAATAPMKHAEHAHQGMNMPGTDMGMMNCPQCLMGMGGMSQPAVAAPAAGAKIAPAAYRTTGGRRCGC